MLIAQDHCFLQKYAWNIIKNMIFFLYLKYLLPISQLVVGVIATLTFP